MNALVNCDVSWIGSKWFLSSWAALGGRRAGVTRRSLAWVMARPTLLLFYLLLCRYIELPIVPTTDVLFCNNLLACHISKSTQILSDSMVKEGF